MSSRFTPRIRATYFPDETDLDAVDYFANVNWLYTGQRTRTRVRGEFAVQDIVNSEQPGVDDGGDLGDPDMGDGGLVLVDNSRTRFNLRPSMNFELSPRRELAFDVGYTDVSFDEQVPGAQVDYNTADASAALVARMNETIHVDDAHSRLALRHLHQRRRRTVTAPSCNGTGERPRIRARICAAARKTSRYRAATTSSPGSSAPASAS